MHAATYMVTYYSRCKQVYSWLRHWQQA